MGRGGMVRLRNPIVDTLSAGKRKGAQKASRLLLQTRDAKPKCAGIMRTILKSVQWRVKAVIGHTAVMICANKNKKASNFQEDRFRLIPILIDPIIFPLRQYSRDSFAE